ncbi:sensor histidine kinase [Enterococcus sp. AZ048]|uniref:sensor histidine kinase n=1 Tax=Enterococcus sp. AZ048 TaxID=2774658 RepID=UPI003F690E43
MKKQKNSLTRSFVLRVSVIFFMIVVLLAVFYRWGFPTYYYWKMEQPVKETQKSIQQGKNPSASSDVVVIDLAAKEFAHEEEATNDLAFRLDKEGISLNRFWVDRTTIQSVQAGVSVQRLYAQTKQKSDFYTLFFQKKDRVYLIGTSIPAFRSAIRTLLPILIAATVLFLGLVFGSVVLLVRNQIIWPIRRLEQTTRKISLLDFAEEEVTSEENELGSLSHAIARMKQSLQQHELEMAARNERLKNFSGNLAHELKTPLAVMRLLVDGEEMEIGNPTFLQDMDQQLSDMSGLVTNLLAYSRQMNEAPVFEPLAIEDVIKREAQQHRLLDPQFSIEERLEPCTVSSNEPLLQIVLNNLLTNGIKYSLNRHLIIRGKRRGTHYQLLVENKAMPMTPEQFSHLLEPFVVGEASRNHHLSGTGLGLSIVQETVHALGGTLQLEQDNGWFRVLLRFPIEMSETK